MPRNLIRKAIFLSSLLLALCCAQVFAQGGTLVALDTVRTAEFHDRVTLTGRTRGAIQSQIVAEVTGRVEAMVAPQGNPVDAGDPLVKLDAEQIKLTLRAKEAEAEQAKAQAELAAANLARAEAWFGDSLIAVTTLDSARAWQRIRKAEFNRIDAERARYALDYENCTIRAPYNGYTVLRKVDVGAWVTPGTPVFEMVNLDAIEVTVDLPERYFGKVTVGSSETVKSSNAAGTDMPGIVTGMAPTASENTHTYPVIIRVPNPDKLLGGGKLVRVDLDLSDLYTGLAIDKDAIIRQGEQTIVYTIKEGNAAPLPVITGSTKGRLISIEGDGIVEGLPVIVRGNERVFPGSPVTYAGAPETGSAEAEPTESQ
jgi:RND family efflux transporter MFP subunit